MTRVLKSSHKCPAPDCPVLVLSHMLACRRHWYALPKPLRDDVWAAYDNGRGAGSPAHVLAVAEACTFLRGSA